MLEKIRQPEYKKELLETETIRKMKTFNRLTDKGDKIIRKQEKRQMKNRKDKTIR